MEKAETKLYILFDSSIRDRDVFLDSIRKPVMDFTSERMRLDSLIHEIAKNIYDHAGGKGELKIEKLANKFDFYIKDEGLESFDLEFCENNSRLKGNGTNYGIGLWHIKEFAKALEIDLVVDTSCGFSYSGTYIKKMS